MTPSPLSATLISSVILTTWRSFWIAIVRDEWARASEKSWPENATAPQNRRQEGQKAPWRKKIPLPGVSKQSFAASCVYTTQWVIREGSRRTAGFSVNKFRQSRQKEWAPSERNLCKQRTVKIVWNVIQIWEWKWVGEEEGHFSWQQIRSFIM